MAKNRKEYKTEHVACDCNGMFRFSYLKTICFIALFSTFSSSFCQPKIQISYSVIKLDSTFDTHQDTRMKAYIDQLDRDMNKEIGVVIGSVAEDMPLETPESPMSDFVVDMLFREGDSISKAKDGISADLALLNFGGIRKSFSAGDAKISDMYEVFPFDNRIVLLTIRGSELKKMIANFNTPATVQPLGNVEIGFKNGRLTKCLIGKKEIIDDQLYRMVTIDFIQTGGDKIIEGIQIESAFNTYILLRDALINYVKSITAQNKEIRQSLDKRVLYE